MKLVDILARELKVWPEGLECLSQFKSTGYIINGKGFDGRTFDALRIADETLVAGAIVTRAEWQAAVDALNAPKAVDDFDGAPDDATHYGVGQTCKFWLKRVDGHWYFINIWGCASGDWHKASDKDNEWIDSREIIARDKSTSEWSEGGLPNVGTKCVVYKGSYNLLGGQENFIGPVVTVTARFKSARGVEMACVDSGTGLGCHLFRADMCFHLPTAEEIAAEERDKAGCDLFCTINWNDGALTWEKLSNERKSDYLKAIDAGWQKVTK